MRLLLHPVYIQASLRDYNKKIRDPSQAKNLVGFSLMEIMENIDPERVRKQRVALGLSQAELSTRIMKAGFGKVSYQAVQQLEEGSTKKPRYAMYLPNALETTWEYLTGRTDNPAPIRSGFVNDLAILSASNDAVRSQNGNGQEGTQVLMEISRMLGAVEGSLKNTFNTRFDSMDRKLDEHDRRLDALEERSSVDPRKGRRR